MGEGAEPNASHEFRGQRSVEPLQLPSPLGMVGAPVDHADPLPLAVAAELLRDEATPIVDVDRLGPPAALERPPECIDNLPGPFPSVGPRHHQVSRSIVHDGGDVDFPHHSRDAERVGVYLPEGVNEVPLEPFERFGFLDHPNHESMSLEDAMNRPPTESNTPPRQDGVDPHGTPGGVPSSQLQDPIGQVPVGAVRAAVRTACLVPKAFHTVSLGSFDTNSAGCARKSRRSCRAPRCGPHVPRVP